MKMLADKRNRIGLCHESLTGDFRACHTLALGLFSIALSSLSGIGLTTVFTTDSNSYSNYRTDTLGRFEF